MRKVTCLFVVLAAVFLAAGCAPAAVEESDAGFVEAGDLPALAPAPMATASLLDMRAPTAETIPDEAEVDVVVSGMHNPVAVALAPDGRLFFTEKDTGHVRVVIDGQILPQPVITVPVVTSAEEGLLGIAVDPDFENNSHIWISYSAPNEDEPGQKINRIARFTLVENTGMDLEISYEQPNSADDGTHNLNNLVFGPDGMLYATAGDDAQDFLANNLGDPRGKILRFRPTVPLSVPEDNPFYDGDGPNEDSIYAYGMRNSFDFAFDPYSTDGRIFATENGPSCDDEVNLIVAGGNYGWHGRYTCSEKRAMTPEPDTIGPILAWEGTSSPTGIVFYMGDHFRDWAGDLFFCSYVDGRLHRLELNRARDGFLNHQVIDGVTCQTDVINGPDGSLYYLEGGGLGEGTLKRIYNLDKG